MSKIRAPNLCARAQHKRQFLGGEAGDVYVNKFESFNIVSMCTVSFRQTPFAFTFGAWLCLCVYAKIRMMTK